MKLFGGLISISGVSFFIFCVFSIMVLGYLLGRISIKNVSLGTAGVFVVALVFGALFYPQLSAQLKMGETSYVSNALKIIENMGLVLFVTSVGFIAAPTFLETFKKNFKSYIALGALIIAIGAATCVGVIALTDCEPAMAVGIMAGSLTSTPAFSAAKETVNVIYGTGAQAYEDMVTVGYGIAYLYGVIGVVLFVQLMPKIMKVDVRALKTGGSADADDAEAVVARDLGRKVEIDSRGFMPFALAVLTGCLVGSIKIPVANSTFSLGTTGGVLVSALVIGHFGHIGPVSTQVKETTLKTFQELGLVLFLMGAGIAGGANFVKYFRPVYFLYGFLMTTLPMIVGFLFAKNVLKISLLNNLGSITGGMTSTPALGTLVNMTGSNDVVSAYASTYPIALLAVVLASQFILMLM